MLTTPNREVNMIWESVGAGRIRHPDHGFEWTRRGIRDRVEGIAWWFGDAVRFQPFHRADERFD